MKTEYPQERFLKAVEKHKLTILKDDGVYRHLFVGIPGTSYESWHIHTWPGYLAMVGDMGDWVFRRTEDMFGFFRTRNDREGLGINPHYWAEKLEAMGRGGCEEFSIETFWDRVQSFACSALDVESFDEVPEDKKDDLWPLLHCEGDEYGAVAAIRDFSSDWLNLDDFWENDCKEYRDRFIFGCYAITWTVSLYDAAKEAQP